MESTGKGSPLEPLTLEGDIDVGNADAVLADLLHDLASRDLGDDDPVEIDCSGLTYLGSRGLQMLVQFRSRSGREIVLARLPVLMRRPFEISGFDELFVFR